jgi:hypothetical protein
MGNLNEGGIIMGGSPYWYIVPHEDPKAALRKLRQREAKAGRYYPAVERPRFPVTEKSPAPGAQHKSIKEALIASDAEGTQSILDIGKISPQPKFLCASPFDENRLIQILGHAKPTREEVMDLKNRLYLFQGIERGHAVYMTLFKSHKPAELLFYGYSVD